MRGLFHSLTIQAASDFFTLIAFLVVFGIVFYRHRLPEWLRSLRAGSWRIAQGSIETGDVTAMRTAVDLRVRFLRAPELARATLGYSYQIDGIFHSGYSKAFTDEQKAWDFVHEWKGQSVLIRCQPDRPDVSVMRLDDQSCSAAVAVLR